MVEGNLEKKKTGIVKQILKWFGLSVLTILIILGFIFQAPYKVISLFLIFLLACTVLPKPLRKWFWLSFGATLIILIAWVFLPDDNEGWRPYTPEKEIAEMRARFAIPDEENAATIYDQLLKNYSDPSDDFPDSNTNSFPIRKPWSSKDHPELAGWLENQQNLIATLLDVSKIEKCRFPINVDIFSDQGIDKLSAIRHWAYLLVTASNNDIAEERFDQAIDKQVAILQMAKHQFQQPAMLGLLVGIALEALAIQEFNNFVVTSEASENYLATIEKALTRTEHNWSSDLHKVLEHEKLSSKNLLLGMFYEINPEGKTRLNRDPTARARASMRDATNDVCVFPSWQKKLTKAYTILGWFSLPSTPQEAAKVIDESYEKYYGTLKPDYDWGKESRKLSIKFNYRYMVGTMANMISGSYGGIHNIYLRLLTDERGSQLLIALRRHKNETGSWPKNLDEIKGLTLPENFVDHYNENPFVYKLTDEDFKLYSKGKNGLDEDGKYDRNWPDKAEADDRLIWPKIKGCQEREKK